MASATYSQNIIFNATPIAINTTTSDGSAVYTAPADRYAVVNMTLSTGDHSVSASTRVSVGVDINNGAQYFISSGAGGAIVANVSNIPVGRISNSNEPTSTDSTMGTISNIIVPPGHSICVRRITNGTFSVGGRVFIYGLEYQIG
jgi:hypothetical protein